MVCDQGSIVKSVYAILQVSMCSGYDLYVPPYLTHKDTATVAELGMGYEAKPPKMLLKPRYDDTYSSRIRR